MSTDLKASVRKQGDAIVIVDMKGDVTSFADETIRAIINLNAL